MISIGVNLRGRCNNDGHFFEEDTSAGGAGGHKLRAQAQLVGRRAQSKFEVQLASHSRTHCFESVRFVCTWTSSRAACLYDATAIHANVQRGRHTRTSSFSLSLAQRSLIENCIPMRPCGVWSLSGPREHASAARARRCDKTFLRPKRSSATRFSEATISLALRMLGLDPVMRACCNCWLRLARASELAVSAVSTSAISPAKSQSCLVTPRVKVVRGDQCQMAHSRFPRAGFGHHSGDQLQGRAARKLTLQVRNGRTGG